MIQNISANQSCKEATIKIAIAFFGITRSLKYTIDSIQENVLAPLRVMGEVKIFGHFFNITEISNSRSGESCSIEPSQHGLIDFDSLIIEEPNDCLIRFDLKGIYSENDPYHDDFKSIRNLLHQLHSLDSVTRSIQEAWQPDFVVFVRPDLCYHESFLASMQSTVRSTDPQIFLPSWQRYSGYNDRFAICNEASYINFGCRAIFVNAYIKSHRPLYSEMFLYYVMKKTHTKVSPLEITASRVRGDGRIEKESFINTSACESWLLRCKSSIRRYL